MGRYSRKTAILAKIETVYGTDATPTGGANALLVSNFSPNPLVSQNVKRELIRPYFGGSEELLGDAYVELSFTVELAGSGALGTPPAWGALLRACGFAEAVTASARVDYTPVTDAIESLTIYYHDDGALHKLLGARGDVSIKMSAGGRPTLDFKFLGLDGGLTAVTNPAVTLTAWKTPLVVNDANTGDLTLGCTYSSGALAGGTAYPSQGIELALGGKVSYTSLLGGASVDFTDRDVSGSIVLDLTAAQEVTFMVDVKANTTQGLGLVHGVADGYKVLMHAPAVQLVNPSKKEVNGRRLIGYDLRLVPSSGNDELRIVSI